MVTAMPERLTGRLSVASLNTWDIHILGSDLAARYAAIGTEFEAGRADVVCFQEVFSDWQLQLLARRMPSFRHVSYRPSAAGPAGGLVTFSRRPVSVTAYRGFGTPPKVPGIPRRIRFRARAKGALVTRLACPGLCIVNTHPVANWDGDWSRTGRFYPLHRAHLGALARMVGSMGVPAVVCGDFNVDRDSSLFGDFMAETGLADAFDGRCAPTFRAEYLPVGKVPHCIDFILTTTGVTAESAGVLFTGKVALPGGPGYPSDHIGLCADLLLTPPARRPG
jgi:endonuclease/exonuclease/phosphatase family metal-dependent hydrolase